MVARAIEPGCISRRVVIFEGPEEYRKSTLVRELAGEDWTVELSIGLDNKEAHMMLRGAWLAELPELDSVSKTEDPRLKAFFTMRKDSYIPKFSNNRVDHPRRTIFCGTTNDVKYLRGQTGNTRYLPIAVGKVADIEGFLQDREQVFAEALDYYSKHQDDWWQMSFAAEAEAIAQRDGRRVTTVLEEELKEWLCEGRFKNQYTYEGMVHTFVPGEVTLEEIGRYFLELPRQADWTTGRIPVEIKDVMEKRLKWTQDFPKRNGKTVRVYKEPQ
jgi:predicted P-loop ATPase